jgi:antitoxin component YwqK of YwqJK toxin-antitoxin module
MKFEAFNSVELNIIKNVFNELSYLQLDVNLAYLVESYIYSIVKNDDTFKIEHRVRFDVKDGIYREWYRNGDKAIECTYKNDKKVGTFTSWFSTLDTGGQRNENDNTFTSCFYSKDNGKLVGKVINWYENGNIAIECSYSNDGKKDGDYKQYSEEGELHLHTIYKDGEIIEKNIQCDPEE